MSKRQNIVRDQSKLSCVHFISDILYQPRNHEVFQDFRQQETDLVSLWLVDGYTFKIGLTLEAFQIAGTTPDAKDTLKMVVTGTTNSKESSLECDTAHCLGHML